MAGIAHIFVSGIIGDDFFSFSEDEMGTTLADVRRQFESFDSPDSVAVHINSPGGDVWEGFAIHDYLINLGLPVTTIGEGKVFSIATVILLAGDSGKREMTPNATFMIHNPMSGDFGNADDLEKVAEELRAIESRLSNFYAEKTGEDTSLLKDMMDAETFLTAEDAKRMGFVDVIREPVKAIAYFKPKKEESLKSDITMTEQDNTQELEKARGLFAELKAFFAKSEAAAPAPEAAQAEEETPEVDSDELLKLKEENANLTARIAELEAAREEAEAGKAAAEQTVTEQAEVIAQVKQRMEALEKLPIIAGGDPTKAAVSKPMGGEATESHDLDRTAAYFAHLINNRR